MSSALPNKQSILAQTIEHFDITTTDTRPMIEQMSKMAFSARDTARATAIVRDMVKDESCAVILCLAGSLISAGLKNVIIDMLRAGRSREVVDILPEFVEQAVSEADSGALTWLLAALDFPTTPAELYAYGTVIGTGNAVMGWLDTPGGAP